MEPANQVTLIIGAGASKDINTSICTGEELIKEIANRITDRNTPNDQYLSKSLNDLYPNKFSMGNRKRIQAYFDYYINSVESPSIDEFLNEINTYTEFEDEKDDILLLGYVMIIAHVFGFEGKENGDTQKRMFEKDTWLSRLSDYIDKKEILEKGGLNIITFNYDRIIEYYLLKKYENSRDIIQFINENVHHVYGRVGCLDKLKQKYIGGNNIEVISEFGSENYKLKEFEEKYMNHIKILYDKRNDTKGLKSIIQNSSQICVFGYGFDSINNRRLGLQNCNDKKDKFMVNVYSGASPNFNFPFRRKMAEKIRGLVMDADIHYGSCSDFLRKCLLV